MFVYMFRVASSKCVINHIYPDQSTCIISCTSSWPRNSRECLKFLVCQISSLLEKILKSQTLSTCMWWHGANTPLVYLKGKFGLA